MKMAQITLSYDAKNTLAKKTLAYILSLGIFKKVENSTIDLSLEEVKKGKTTTYKSVDDFFKNLEK